MGENKRAKKKQQIKYFIKNLKNSKARNKYKPLHGTFIDPKQKNSTKTIQRIERNCIELEEFFKCYGKEIIIKDIE